MTPGGWEYVGINCEPLFAIFDAATRPCLVWLATSTIGLINHLR